MDALECIINRRSIRKFEDKPVHTEIITTILECGRWAPSGVNFQPWKVFVVTEKQYKKQLARCTKYSQIIENAPHTFVIYLDQTKKYNYIKHVQSIGAFFQNLLLAIHANGLGGVWLGEIYNQKEEVNKIFDIKDKNLEFMGAISFGFPLEKGKSNRKSIEEFVIWK